MKQKKVLVIGATGLVGRQVVFSLGNDPNVVSVVCLVRGSVKSINSKVVYYKINFEKLEAHESLFDNVTDVICCIGSTIKKAKSKEKFKFIDYQIPKRVAQIAKVKGVDSFSLISSMGATSKSRFFYLRVKGEIEDDLKLCNFQRTLIYRPSLLLGNRLEYRIGEKLMMLFFSLFSWCIPLKYLPTDSILLAQMIIKNLHNQKFGIYEFDSHMIL